MPELQDDDRRLAVALSSVMKAGRARAGLKQTEAAEMAGMDPKHYQALENGFSSYRDRAPANPSMRTLRDLATAYGIEPVDFVADVFRTLEIEYDGPSLADRRDARSRRA